VPWLFPREHGAYGQLGLPMLAALLAGRPSLVAALLIVSYTAGFIAHEPALVLLGQRGARARREQQAEARGTLAAVGGLAVLAGAAGFLLTPPPLRWTVLVPAAFALAAVPMVLQKRQKTATGEMHIALTLASCAVPVGVAAGLSAQEAAVVWLIFTAGFWAATLGVRATIAVQRREPSAGSRVVAGLLALAAPFSVAASAARFALSPLLWTAVLPLSVLALALAAVPPQARHLRRVGWWLMGGGLSSAVLVVIFLRF
jgi:hypothetical protein